MDKTWFLFIAVAVVLALGGCSKEEYTYEFTTGGCTTGKQVFANSQELCDGLQSLSRNNGCAASQTLREQAFTSRGCPGVFTARP